MGHRGSLPTQIDFNVGKPPLSQKPSAIPQLIEDRIWGWCCARRRGRRPGQPQGTQGCPEHTSNRITSLRMTAEMRSKSLSYCVTRDSHCRDRKCTAWGVQGEGTPAPLSMGLWSHDCTRERCCWSRAPSFQPLSQRSQEAGLQAAPFCSLTQG